MCVCSELQRDAYCCSGGWHGYCAGMCAVNLSWCQLWEGSSSQCLTDQLLGNPPAPATITVELTSLLCTASCNRCCREWHLLKGCYPRKTNAVHIDGPSYAGDAVLFWVFLGLVEDLGRRALLPVHFLHCLL